jgi:DNA primase
VDKPEIVSTIERECGSLHRRGRSFWLSCPSHSDKTPSLKIDSERQTFYCFSCNEGGDVIAFIQKLHGCDFKEALRILGMNGNRRPRTDTRERKKRDLLKAFRAWEWRYRGELADRFREIYEKTHEFKTIEEAEAVADLFYSLPCVEYYLDLLWNGDDETKYELYRSLTNGNEK